MNKLSKRHNRIEPSSTIATAKLSRQLIAEGKDVIFLVGEAWGFCGRWLGSFSQHTRHRF